MNILFFTRRFYPDIGGVEKHVLEIGKRFVAQGHSVTVITEEQNEAIHFRRLPRFARNDNINNIEIIRIAVGREDWFKKFRMWRSLWSLRSIITGADVVHCHDVFFWYLPFRFLFPTKPVYTTFHGYESYPIKKKAIIVRKISEALSFGNICIGDFIKKWYYTKPTFVSYGAVDHSHSVIARSEAQTTKQSHKLEIAALPAVARNDVKKGSAVFIGRLDEQTGIQTYVRAVEILKKKYPKFACLVVGDGTYKKQIEKKVKTVGLQNNPGKYFARYRFAFVSRYLSILEAFAAKRLVFAVFDNPVKEDYLRMAPFASFIIIAKTPSELTRKVIFFLEHPELEKKFIEKAYEWVRKQTWEEMAKIYLRLWRLY